MSAIAPVAVKISPKFFNPVGFHMWRFMNDPAIRIIINKGGSSSAKSYSVAQLFLLFTKWFGDNHLVMRKVGASISNTIYEDFKSAARQFGMLGDFKFKDGTRQIVCVANKARIDFKGLDDPEKIKGISSYKRVFLDEFSEYDIDDFKQIRKRLRGKKGQQIVVAFNPISEKHWIKTDFIDHEQWNDMPMNVRWGNVDIPLKYTEVKALMINSERPVRNLRTKKIEMHAPDIVLIQSTYLNNFWVVGSPDGTYGFYDDQCIADFEKDRESDPDYYNIYALGEWGVLRTGSEFFGSFNRGIHCQEIEFDPALPIHISIDNNVLPYISVTYWQIDTSEGVHIRQIDETCAGNPDNTVRRAAKMTADKLKSYGASEVYLHGDASTRAANNIDEEKRSWIDLFIDTLQSEGIDVHDMVGHRNPSVSLSGEFINTIYEGGFEGYDITIDERRCRTSIDDYMAVQKDVNGAILKRRLKNKTTMQTYEEHGHLSDTKRYLVTDVLRDEFRAFSNKRNTYVRDGMLSFYNPATECRYIDELLYCMPNINGKFAFVHGRKCGDRWHIVSACLLDGASSDEIKDTLGACGSARTILECSRSYYMMARELRVELDGDVRVIHESGDIPRRIAATTDFVKERILFNNSAMEADAGYSAYMANLLDYGRNNAYIESSAVISGFALAVLKLNL